MVARSAGSLASIYEIRDLHGPLKSRVARFESNLSGLWHTLKFYTKVDSSAIKNGLEPASREYIKQPRLHTSTPKLYG